MKRHVRMVIIGLFLLSSCKHESNPPDPPSGHVSFRFEHAAGGAPLQTDTVIYTNAAGNPYMVTDLMYFISDVTFYHHDGSRILIRDRKDIFYIDIAIPATLEQQFHDDLPAGVYDSVSFVFGITGEKNISFMYTSPPEVIMAWPEVLGGGYHYMMLNGKWRDTAGVLKPFNFHLGIGQLYKGNVINIDSIYAFVQNWFRVSLPGSAFTLAEGENKLMTIEMDVNSWFGTPHAWNHNIWGGAIMQNQPAMQMAKENGYDVFSIKNTLSLFKH